MLRDLEELLHCVNEEASRNYMAEAVRCYQAGMYRAAVVMAMAAAMDDLRQKLGALVATGASGIDIGIREAHAQIEHRFESQEAFENQLIEITRKLDMYSPAEEVKLKQLLKVRHLCAHPSGHRSTAEEARECIASLVDLVLSRQPLMGVAAVTALLERLKQPHFFPMIEDESRAASLAQAEMRPLLASALPALAARLVDALAKEESEPTQPPPQLRVKFKIPWTSPARENLRAFAKAMLRAGDPMRRALWLRMGRLIENAATHRDALILLAADPSGLSLIAENPLVRERAIALARRNLWVLEARVAVRGWRMANILRPEELSELLKAGGIEFSNVDESSASAALELEWPELDELFFGKAVQDCGTNVWSQANPAIAAMQGLTSERAMRVPIKLRASYILNVARYSRGVYANNSARTLPGSGLGLRRDFLPALGEVLDSSPAAVRATPTDWESVVMIISASGGAYLIPKLLDLFASPATEAEEAGALSLAKCLESHPDQTISTKARALIEASRLRSAPASGLASGG